MIGAQKCAGCGAVYKTLSDVGPRGCAKCGEVVFKTVGEDDAVDHPVHYTSHPSGVEAVDVCEHMTFNAGNAVKYLWRAGLKGNDAEDKRAKHVEDLRKAAWYVNREIERLTKGGEGR